MFNRPILNRILERFTEPNSFIQVLSGPRQTGKTTLARQMLQMIECPCHYATADEPALKDQAWIEQQWEAARLKLKSRPSADRAVLVLDEIQKLPSWSETVKRLWDEDTASGLPLHALILGSSPLLVQKGLAESLAGRFELIRITHWSYAEMRDAFGFSLDEFIFHGGYPGAAGLIHDRPRWASYIYDSLIETTISRDILQMTRVDKPALLKQLFELGCAYSGQILSYQKMVGQLQDAGNTTTLSHYLNLLGGAGLLTGLPKYSGGVVRQRASSPKLMVLNTGLMTAGMHLDLETAIADREMWGRLVESAVGAFLYNGALLSNTDLFYWAGKNRELDFVLARGRDLVAVEVKSTNKKMRLPGMSEFARQFPVTRKILVGAQGIPIEEFLLLSINDLF